MRSTEHHPHQTISKLFMTLDLDRNPSITSIKPATKATTSTTLTKPSDPATEPSILPSKPSITLKSTTFRSVSDSTTTQPPSQPQRPQLNLNKSTPLTPPWTPNGRKATTVLHPVRSQTKAQAMVTRPKVRSPVTPITPVTPSRAPAKALKLLGTSTQNPSMPSRTRKRDRFGALPEIEKFFHSTMIMNGTKSKSSPFPNAPTKSRSPTFPKMRSVSDGTLIKQSHKSKTGDEWLDMDVEVEKEFGRLKSDPSVRGGRSDIGRYTSDEDEVEVEVEVEVQDWDLRAFSHVLPVQKGSKRIDIDESFVDLFADDTFTSRAKSKSNAKGRATTNRDYDNGHPKTKVPHPWSAAALSDSPPPPLVSNRHVSPSQKHGHGHGYTSSSGSGSGSGSSSGPPSPGSDIIQTPPRPVRPKKRPPPLVLDTGKPARLPIIILNSPITNLTPYSKNPMTPSLAKGDGVSVTESSRQSTISQVGARTPFVHPRRAPRPIPSSPMAMPLPIGKPRILDYDLAKASLPRTTDTRMPLLPPLQLTPEDEYPISVFEPVTPTDTTYPGGMGRGGGGGGDKKGGWLKKVVRDFGQSKI